MQLVVIGWLQLAAVAGAADPGTIHPGPVYHGGRNELEVAVPRLERTIVVDGRLDEPAWLEAAVLTGFSQYAPVDGVPAADSTEVLVWYSADAIHFGIRAFEPHGQVNSTLADRDRIASDDAIEILLDTFNDGRRALVFAVNPLGIQSDGVRSEANRQRSGSFDAGPDEAGVDLSPDYVYESKGQLTEFGYQVEVRIPFKSIRYQARRVQDWGINVVRRVQHSGHEQTWTPARRGLASFLAQNGRLRGLTGLDQGPVLDLNPVATMKVDGARSANGWRYGEAEPEFGFNARWGVTANLTLNGTVNPDFSQVESDAGQLVYDPRSALYFAEKRPFFLEGSEHFEVPSRLIYSRRIVEPVAAAKLTGNISGTDVGILSAVDDRVHSASGEDHPVYNIVRLRRDVGSASTVGVVYTDRVDGDDYNRVAGADARLVFGGVWALSLQGAASIDRRGGEQTTAPLWAASLTRRGRRFGLTVSMDGKDPEFRAGSGFISRPGVANVGITPRITFPGAPGARIESWSTSLAILGNWDYDRFVRGLASQDRKLHLNNTIVLRGGWRLGASVLLESFGYPPDLYRDYAVERQLGGGATDTVPFVGTPRIGNLDFVFDITTPEFSRFSGSLFAIVGRDENFHEWAPAYVAILTASADWRPTEQVRVQFTHNRQQYIRPDDRSTVSVRDIPRLKLEYQLTRAIFVRFVGQYDAFEQDDLRDDTRTGDPILIRNPATGVYERALGYSTNDFRVDWLFSYQPTPGTVIFAGYGSSLAEADRLRFRGLERTADGFFLKLSYLFRV